MASKHPIDLAKIFGVEGMVTPKTLINETKEDVKRKKANDQAQDVRALLDELAVKVAAQDVNGIIDVIRASQLRLECMMEIATEIKNAVDKSGKK